MLFDNLDLGISGRALGSRGRFACGASGGRGTHVGEHARVAVRLRELQVDPKEIVGGPYENLHMPTIQKASSHCVTNHRDTGTGYDTGEGGKKICK